MDLSSWFRRKLLSNKAQIPDHPKLLYCKGKQEDEELLGVTDELIDCVKTFTLDSFREFPPEDSEALSICDDAPAKSGHVQQDLSEWQARHAALVLSKVKELSQLRYILCPRYLKEQQFWKIYFKLVKKYVAEYELRAVRLEKLRTIAVNEDKPPDGSAVEVEMSETKLTTNLSPSSP